MMSLNRYYHIYCPEGVVSKYSLLVIDPDEETFLPLTDFYSDLLGRVGNKTALSYLTSMESFFSWLDKYGKYQEQQVKWNDPPERIREVVQDYLYSELSCKVMDKDNYRLVNLTNKSPNTVMRSLSAIKAFYKSMIRLKSYPYPNPLLYIENVLRELEEPVEGVRKDKPRLPAAAGTEVPIHQHRRLTDSYFKVVNEEWVPLIIGDWDLPFKVYNAGKAIGWTLRDEIVTRLLFETGARVTEILELTFGDYRM